MPHFTAPARRAQARARLSASGRKPPQRAATRRNEDRACAPLNAVRASRLPKAALIEGAATPRLQRRDHAPLQQQQQIHFWQLMQ
ncbi:MAG: hypothetical protein ACRYGK_02685 [Janthinobacterium lividum]